MFIELLSPLRMLTRFIYWLTLGLFVAWIATLAVHALPGTSDTFTLMLTIFGSAGATAALWFALRPARRALLCRICSWMARSGIDVLVYFGVWELLVNAVTPRRGADADYAGLANLHRAYDCANSKRRTKILRAARTIGQSPSCNVFQQSLMFLDAVD